MRKFVLVFIVLLAAVLLIACGGGGGPYPAPGDDQPAEGKPTDQGGEPYPEPNESKLPDTDPSQAGNEYAPQPGDTTLLRGSVYIDSSEILLLESYPVQVRLLLIGSLPTSCHQLRAQTSAADDQNRIDVEVYSVVDPEMACTEALEPFEAGIPIGTYTDGIYTVWLNGEEVGTVNLSQD